MKETTEDNTPALDFCPVQPGQLESNVWWVTNNHVVAVGDDPYDAVFLSIPTLQHMLKEVSK